MKKKKKKHELKFSWVTYSEKERNKLLLSNMQKASHRERDREKKKILTNKSDVVMVERDLLLFRVTI